MTTTHPVVWFEVLGKDGGKLQRFYGDLFGWRFKVDNPFGYGVVEAGQKQGIPGGVGATIPGTRSWVTFYVQSPDLNATLAEVEKRGGKVVLPPKDLPDGPPIAAFEDPEGHVIGLVQSQPA